MKSHSDLTARPRLIGLCGLAGAGKSAAARILIEDHGFSRISFADPIKAMMAALLSFGGADAALVERMLSGDLKEVPAPALFGVTPRHAMQTLGTEWGRVQIDAGLWRRQAMTRAKGILVAGGRVVIDDVRFLNEFAAIWDQRDALGRPIGDIWRLQGRGGLADPAAAVHPSEGAAVDVDMILRNDGTLADLRALIGAEFETGGA